LICGPDGASAARHLKTSKRKRGNKKGKRGREPTIVIVFFHRTTIDGESSQKLKIFVKMWRLLSDFKKGQKY
jgi:hypothetical protein